MNTEIVRELVRQWRTKAEPAPMEYMEEVTDEASAPQDLLAKKVDEAVQATLRHCAQDLEDVIRIYDDFRGVKPNQSIYDIIRNEVKPYALNKP